MPDFHLRSIVKPESEVRFPESSVKTVVQERAGASHRFFCGLPYKDDGPAPLVLQFVERTRRANEGGHMNIVAARVHHRDFTAVGILCHDSARVGKTGFLTH